MICGCTGGKFFYESDFQWLDANNPEAFTVLWDEITPLPKALPFATWIANGLSAEVANENKWWTYTSDITRIDVVRPDWWDVGESDMIVSLQFVVLRLFTYFAQRYFPEQMVPKAYLTECDTLTETAAVMLESMRQLLQDKFHFG